MLGLMRERVLMLPRERLFWLPVPQDGCCGYCSSYFMATIHAVQPKMVLLMGDRSIQSLQALSKAGPVEMGKEIKLRLSYGEVPALWTLHPGYLEMNPQSKGEAFKHLKTFKELMGRHRLG